MAESNGDTLEFLRIMGTGAQAPAAPQARSEADEAPRRPAPCGVTELTFSDLPPVTDEAAPQAPASSAAAEPAFPGVPAVPEEPKPVVIKGGPRRIVRADGQQPQTSYALGQQRFALSSGHALFAPKKRRNLLRETIITLVLMAAVAGVFALAWNVGRASITLDKQRDLVGTTAYDGALSLTPAADGGYYTAFFVTSTDTDEGQIGTLDQAILYRTDKGVTQATRVTVPANLYVAASGSATEARTLRQVLDSQSITRTLQAVDKALGTRIYNVVCCDQETFALLEPIITGQQPASAVDPDALLGDVWSNLTLEGVVDYCAQLGALDQTQVRGLAVPTSDLDVNGTVMAQCTPDAYLAALNASQSVPANVRYDDRGNFAGTQYDEWGNPLLDETGAPSGALRDEWGNLIFDENGYLQFYGQQYDANGWPVGTQYDEWGNPLLDEWGNPLGSQYNEYGDFQRDWRGNIVIVAQ